ncbi:MAG TPA: SAV_6107 family HEPN domain-containing protein [Jatrophihabitans sp.]|nr:SAV_6107 family HEPN domain-containing protein [Jatrophihabitans sp.]
MAAQLLGGQSAVLLRHARDLLAEADGAGESAERFRLAHLAALRIGAAAVAQHGWPASARRRLVSVWVLLEKVAPDYRHWVSYFAAGAPVRAAVEAGVLTAVSPQMADDQVRAAGQFLACVEDSLGMLAA